MTADASSSNRNVELLREAFNTMNERGFEACVHLLASDFIINLAGMPFQMRGTEAWLGNARVMQAAFPDLKATVDDIFGSGDRVAVRVTFRGTHTGEFQGIPASGRPIEFVSHEFYRVADGKLAEEWICGDMATLMGQMTNPQR